MDNKQNQWPRYWQQLGVMIDAGLTIESALRTLDEKIYNKRKSKNKGSKALERSIGLVQRGQSLSTAFKKAACINKTDFTILSIAEEAGKLPLGLKTIAKRRSAWLARIESLKAGLILPKGLLLLGALAGVFIRTASSGQSLPEALVSVVVVLVIAWTLIEVTVRLIQVDSLLWLSLGWRVRILRTRWMVYILAYESLFYRLLAWQVGSGVSPDKALKSCALLLSARNFKQSVMTAAQEAGHGSRVSDVLIANGLVLSQPLERVLITSMQVGSWDDAVVSHIEVQQKRLSLKADDFFKWLPRVYYLIALLAVSQFMFA